VHEINGGLGKDIHLYPDQDLAILLSDTKLDQAFLPISYADVPVGQEIGVAGYPLARLLTDAGGNVTLGGLVYRVAKGVATAYYRTNLDSGYGHPLNDRMVLEVNFLFVPGNSGGPIFDAENGRVIAYVEGFQHYKIKEVLEHYTQTPVPGGMSAEYLDSVYAVYSVGSNLRNLVCVFDPIIDACNPSRANNRLEMSCRLGGSGNAGAAKRDYLGFRVFQIKLNPGTTSPSKHKILLLTLRH